MKQLAVDIRPSGLRSLSGRREDMSAAEARELEKSNEDIGIR